MRRRVPLRTYARPSPHRRPVMRFDPPPQLAEYNPPPLPASLPLTWKRAAGLALLTLASLAFVVLQILAVLRVVALLVITPAAAEPIAPQDVRVIDGDTIRVQHKRPDVRLVGFNAPETRRALCEAEAEQGARATRRLRELVDAGNLDFRFVPCSCRPGTEGTDACNFGRRCGRLMANGRDVGAILIREGLAAQFTCAAISCPRLPRPWC